MARRPGDASGRAAPDPESEKPSANAGSARHERLSALLDQCTAARTEADSLGERFLTYLLAMAIEEARSATQRASDPLRRPD